MIHINPSLLPTTSRETKQNSPIKPQTKSIHTQINTTFQALQFPKQTAPYKPMTRSIAVYPKNTPTQLPAVEKKMPLSTLINRASQTPQSMPMTKSGVILPNPQRLQSLIVEKKMPLNTTFQTLQFPKQTTQYKPMAKSVSVYPKNTPTQPSAVKIKKPLIINHTSQTPPSMPITKSGVILPNPLRLQSLTVEKKMPLNTTFQALQFPKQIAPYKPMTRSVAVYPKNTLTQPSAVETKKPLTPLVNNTFQTLQFPKQTTQYKPMAKSVSVYPKNTPSQPLDVKTKKPLNASPRATNVYSPQKFTQAQSSFLNSRKQKVEVFPRNSFTLNKNLKTSESKIKCLSGKQQHINFLFKQIRKAKSSIFIATYKLDFIYEIFSELRNAERRGVDIWLCFNEPARDFSSQNKIFNNTFDFVNFDNHAKAAIFDDKKIALGSYNWISENPYEKEYAHEEISVVLKGKEGENVIQEFHEFGEIYNESFDDDLKLTARNLTNYLRNTLIIRAPCLQDNKSISLLTTPQQHYRFLTEAFKIAKKTIEIHSPFVSTDFSSLQQRLNKTQIEKFLSEGKQLVLFGNINSKEIFDNYFTNWKYKPEVICESHFHRKLFVIDNSTAAIGSFNWMSAYLDINENNMHNQYNTTMVLRNEEGKKFLDKL